MIRAAKHLGHTGIVIEFCHAAGNHDSSGTGRLCVVITHFVKQLINTGIVLTLRDYRKFIAADAKDGTVLEDIADNHAGVTDMLIPRLMAFCIVDLFQVIHV